MFTKVHHEALTVECQSPAGIFSGSNIPAQGSFAATTFAPVITAYQDGGWGWYVGSGRSLLDLSMSYQADSPQSGILNSPQSSSTWCNCSITSAKPAVINALHYYYASDDTNYRKKVRYIDLYRIENGAYILHQTFNTSAPQMWGPSNELLTLTKPIEFTGQIELRVVVRNHWNDNNGYMWVSEIYIKGFTLG